MLGVSRDHIGQTASRADAKPSAPSSSGLFLRPCKSIRIEHDFAIPALHLLEPSIIGRCYVRHHVDLEAKIGRHRRQNVDALTE